MMEEVKKKDSYHQAFFYCVGISDMTRDNVKRLFSFREDCINPAALHEGWQTSGSMRITGLLLIYGTDTARRGWKECLPRMNFLIVDMPLISLRQSG